MRIKLQHPFIEEFSRAYLSTNSKDGRSRVTLFRKDRTGTFMQYARYLMCIKEGRILKDTEEVDHIDKDKTNDSLDNLQILSVLEHKEKTKMEVSGRTIKLLACENCGSMFEREIRNIKNKRNFCSRSCASKFYSASRTSTISTPKITEEDIIKIKDLMEENMSSYDIAKIITNISRATIARHMKKIKEGL